MITIILLYLKKIIHIIKSKNCYLVIKNCEGTEIRSDYILPLLQMFFCLPLGFLNDRASSKSSRSSLI